MFRVTILCATNMTQANSTSFWISHFLVHAALGSDMCNDGVNVSMYCDPLIVVSVQ
jgi:hypothetical protein